MNGCASLHLLRHGTGFAPRFDRGPPAWAPTKEQTMPAVNKPLHQKGDYLVDYEEKVFPDVKAEPGEKALVTFHTVAFEGSIGFVNRRAAMLLQHQGVRTSVLPFRPGIKHSLHRGFTAHSDGA